MHSDYSLRPLTIRIAQTVGVLLCVCMLLGALPGCDGVTVQTPDQAGDAMNAENVRINTEPFTQVDLLFDSGAIPPGESFTIELLDDEHESPVTRITHEGLSDGRQRLAVNFHPLDPASVAIECQNEGTTVYRDELTPPSNDQSEVDMKVATTDDEPDSYHYSEEDGDVVVSVDYENTEEKSIESVGTASVQFSSNTEPASCTHVAFALTGISTPFTPNGVLFSGATQKPTFQKQKFQ